MIEALILAPLGILALIELIRTIRDERRMPTLLDVDLGRVRRNP